MNTKESLLNIARRTLQIEEDTLAGLRDSLDHAFVEAALAIKEAPGRLVVTGVGKSALIGQKIVATLNSTGTPSLFMHAADAIHGDLGMIQKGDIVLCISKSGQTAEVKVLVPLLIHRNLPLIGMTAEKQSHLAKHAHYLLYTPVPQEADPNNLAPTASTTAQAAMGDALATTLLALRGFTASDFAHFHPGGALGKQLYLRVSDLLDLHEKPQVLPTASLQEVIVEITGKRLGATAVIDDFGHLMGMITDGDLRRMLERTNAQSTQLTAVDIMSANPKTILAELMAVEALQLLQQHEITQLIVVDNNGKYAGMIHMHDLLREGLA